MDQLQQEDLLLHTNLFNNIRFRKGSPKGAFSVFLQLQNVWYFGLYLFALANHREKPWLLVKENRFFDLLVQG